MVSQGTGITDDETINCHMAKNVGEKTITQLTGRQFINIKMIGSDNVRSLATITSKVNIKDKVIEPVVFYQSKLFVKNSDDLAYYFKYDLAPYPLAGIRKTIKSDLYEEFSIVDYQELGKIDCFVIDSCYLLHA